MQRGYAEAVLSDVRDRGWIASIRELPGGEYEVKLASAWGTETISDFRQWLNHPARQHRQTPDPDGETQTLPKYAG